MNKSSWADRTPLAAGFQNHFKFNRSNSPTAEKY